MASRSSIGITRPFLLLHVLFTLPASIISTDTDCPKQCGNLSIPFPFGTRPGCHYGNFLLTCNDTFDPPRTFLEKGNVEVTSLNPSNSTVTVQSLVAPVCNQSNNPNQSITASVQLSVSDTYAISNNSNIFVALGCNALAYYNIFPKRNSALFYRSGCASMCGQENNIRDKICSGIGCCQTAIPIGLQAFNATVQTVSFFKNTLDFSPCSYAFLIDANQYEFKASDLKDFSNRKKVPVVLDWAVAVESNGNCTLCGENTNCSNSINPAGYRCFCKDGYEGNPYKGCQDIDECKGNNTNNCSHICQNTPGNYSCACPDGYKGDGNKNGSGCDKQKMMIPVIYAVVGCGVGLLIILALLILYYFRKKQRMFFKEKFFKENGGILLQEQLSTKEGVAVRIFSSEELEHATDNYAESRILVKGAIGTVYKGILPNNDLVVSIKKSQYADATQKEVFINEILLLSQVVHKNVVRLLGCCLETEVPLLIYEYVSNGSLDDHLHKQPSSLSWVQRLRIAGETAEALAYLHSGIKERIFHRDVKAANILLNENYMAKMSDFGLSKLIPLGSKQITALVSGTLGYLDPEYSQTCQLTEKSDVYSFGVVLAELLTGEKPISSERQLTAMENLANYLIIKLQKGELQEIVEERVKNEGSWEQIEAFALLANWCLKLKGDERPTMREVAAEIERIRRLKNDFAREEEE